MDAALQLRSRMDFFRRRCQEHGLTGTHQRQILYRALAESDDHPSPEALYERVKRKIPAISLGTVYRNIKLFREIGLLKEPTPLHELSRLDANLSDHHHLICRSCGSITDLPAEQVESVHFREGIPSGFKIERYEIEILGLCRLCGAKSKASGTSESPKQKSEK